MHIHLSDIMALPELTLTNSHLIQESKVKLLHQTRASPAPSCPFLTLPHYDLISGIPVASSGCLAPWVEPAHLCPLKGQARAITSCWPPAMCLPHCREDRMAFLSKDFLLLLSHPAACLWPCHHLLAQ